VSDFVRTPKEDSKEFCNNSGDLFMKSELSKPATRRHIYICPSVCSVLPVARIDPQSSAYIITGKIRGSRSYFVTHLPFLSLFYAQIKVNCNVSC